jgi:hypothetical protein
MTTQENITPPASPFVSIMAIREPSGVLHQDRALAWTGARFSLISGQSVLLFRSDRPGSWNG